MIYRIFVEKKPEYSVATERIKREIKDILGVKAASIRIFLRYDIDGMTDDDYRASRSTVFSEPPVDFVYEENLPDTGGAMLFAVEYLPGQYDQRADSAAQCVQLLTRKNRPIIKCATVYAFDGIVAEDFAKIKKYLVNPVESREASLQKPETLSFTADEPEGVETVGGFIDFSLDMLAAYHTQSGFAMSIADLEFVRDYFKSEDRDPTVTELKVIDTYWSDHCRHTTFFTAFDDVKIKSENPHISDAFERYSELFDKHHTGKGRSKTLMDIATMGARELKSQGLIPDLDESEEINACSIKVKADVDGQKKDYLVMFKNETHNHPTEIEPFGGAATCLGGAIRDPLSGRSYVYHAMRITGAGDITESFDKTLKGKLPQRVISKTAAAGFSSYGNQIGLATGIVHEVFHPKYVAKRLETGFVVGAAPMENVVRKVPQEGDIVLLIGGETGRDGCGGATGSSKAHTEGSLGTCGAEVQKGNPLTERKIQRLFRSKEMTTLIKRCNDFGAGGVSVAIGELARSLDIFLDLVPKKYDGLSATEIAISESQERMAVVIDKNDLEKAVALCREENLTATMVASVTDTGYMRMYYKDALIVSLSRDMLDTNGARQSATAVIAEPVSEYMDKVSEEAKPYIAKKDFGGAALADLKRLNVCSQKGLGEIFDSTIGAGTVLMPFGGRNQLTPSISMAAKIPVEEGSTNTATVCSWGFNPYLMSESPFIGAVHSVILSVIKVAIGGADYDGIRLTLQEFFQRLRNDPKRWGQPLSALLGALTAQLGLGLPAIGGKDSMSGTFEEIDVPPTLISFALGIARADKVTANTATKAGEKLYLLPVKRDNYGMPDFEHLRLMLKAVQTEIYKGNIRFATVAEEGGAVAAVIKSCIGNGFGFNFDKPDKQLFMPRFGDVIVSVENIAPLSVFAEYLGEVTEGGFVFGKDEIAAEEAERAFTSRFEKIYPFRPETGGDAETLTFYTTSTVRPLTTVAKPRVFIPVFPGTNCEYDTHRRFVAAGAETDIFVIKNLTPQDIEESVSEIAKRISKAQIIAFPGGFSGGDEPDGSGKFIATTFRNARIADAVTELLNAKDGLIIGICNGFQALIKLGLVPYGGIRELSEGSPTLTFNNINRHVSTISRIRVASTKSPWLSLVKPGDEFGVAISHGEGKFVASGEDIKKLIRAGQICTQYVDFSGNATMQTPFNPNGSYFAVEGITSADGRILGKMGHSERIGERLMKNIDLPFDMQIFEAGVKYFK